MPGRTVGFSDPIFAGAKTVDVNATLTNANGGSIDVTLEDERIIGGMRLIALEIGNPEAVGANINFHPTFGELQITCDDIEGSTTIKASFLKIDDDPTAIKSSEYDILNNKIELIKNVDVNFPITIETTDWALDNVSGHYVYTWTNSAVTTECSVDVQFLESQDDADVDCVYSEKVTGGVQFSVDYVPSVDIPVNVKITNTRPKAIVSDITAEMVSQEAVSGASNVEEALSALNSNFTYSTTEHIVGKWIDGSPIYERSFEDLTSHDTNFYLTNELTKSSIVLIGVYSTLLDADGWKPLFDATVNGTFYRVTIRVDASGVLILLDHEVIQKLFVTLRYLKV